MSTSNAIRFMQQRQDSLASISLRLFALIIFVSLFAASAESVKAVSCYSDSWMDDSGSEPADGVYDEGQMIYEPYVVGCGVTHFYYYEPYHDAEVDTTITSPDGRSSTVSGFDDPGGYKQAFNARAEAILPMVNYNASTFDVGDYLVSSHHYSECPVTDFGTTSSSLPAGVSISCYRLDGYSRNGNLVIGVYSIISPCPSTCKGNTASIRYNRGPSFIPKDFLAGAEPYVGKGRYKVCGRITSYNPVDVCNSCSDVDLPPLPFFF